MLKLDNSLTRLDIIMRKLNSEFDKLFSSCQKDFDKLKSSYEKKIKQEEAEK